MRELMLLLVVRRGRTRVFLGKRTAQDGLERVALVLRHDDEPPGYELAMVGRPRGDGQDVLELRRCRSGADELARLSRAAGFEQRQKRGAVVEHRSPQI